MPRGGNEFGREVIRRATGGVGLAHDDLRQAHVGELQQPILVQQDVLRLQITC